MDNFRIDKLPKDIRSDLAKKHKDLRRQQGLTQREMAERSGVSLGSLKRFETQGEVSLVSLLKLVKVLGRLDDFENVLGSMGQPKRIELLFEPKKEN